MSIIGTQMNSAVSYLTERLRIDQTASIDTVMSSAALKTGTTTVDTDASHVLMLKDRIEAGGYTYTSVSIKERHMEVLSGYLEQLRDIAIEIQSYAAGSTEDENAMARSQAIEQEMSAFIGSVVHGQDLTPYAVFSKEQTEHSFMDFVDIDVDDGSTSQQIAAIEIDFGALFANLHNPVTCTHCAEAAAGRAQQTSHASGVLEPYASTAYDDSTAGAVAAPNTGVTSLEPLRMGTRWTPTNTITSNATQIGNGVRFHLLAASNDTVLATWEDSDTNKIVAQRFDYDGTAVSAKVQLANDWDTHIPAIEELANGNIVVAYQNYTSGYRQAEYHVLDSQLNVLVSGVASQNSNDDHVGIQIVDLENGQFVIDYDVVDNFPGRPFGKKQRVFDYDGSPQNTEYTYHTETGSSQRSDLHYTTNGEVLSLFVDDANKNLKTIAIDISSGLPTLGSNLHRFTDQSYSTSVELMKARDGFYVGFSDDGASKLAKIDADGQTIISPSTIINSGSNFLVLDLSDELLAVAYSPEGPGNAYIPMGDQETFVKIVNRDDFSEVVPATKIADGGLTTDSELVLVEDGVSLIVPTRRGTSISLNNVSIKEMLSYSYYEGNVGYDPNYNGGAGTPGTPSGVEAAGTGNSAALDQAFAAWDEAVAFDFEKVIESGTTVGELRVAFTDEGTTGGRAAFAYGPGSSYTLNGQTYVDSFSANGDIYFETADINTNGNANPDFQPTGVGAEGFNYFTALHEIGHALGLSHPFDGGSDTGATLDLDLDNMRQTVMTYVQTDRNVDFSIVDNGNGTFSTGLDRVYASTPGMLDYDIMAKLYGAETNSETTNVDNTYNLVHGYDLTGGSVSGSLTIKTIADSGGVDTFDTSGVTRDSIIDLNPGAFSSIGIFTEAEQKAYWANQTGLSENQIQSWIDDLDASASASNSYYPSYQRSALYTGTNNVGIASSTIIENAIGGSGNDVISGNDANNQLEGGDGDDVISGGAGNDTILLGAGSGTAYGEDGNDLFVLNGSGAQTFDGGDGFDTFHSEYSQRFTQGENAIEFNLAEGWTGQRGNRDFPLTDGLENIENISYAGTLDTYMFGEAQNNAFFGGKGKDTIDGGGGTDDTAVYGESSSTASIYSGSVTTLSVTGSHTANEKIGFSLRDSNSNVFEVSIRPSDTRTVEVAKALASADILDSNGNITTTSGFFITHHDSATNGATIIVRREDNSDFQVALLADNHVNTNFGIEGRIADGASALDTNGYSVAAVSASNNDIYTVVIEDSHGSANFDEVNYGFDRLTGVEFLAFDEQVSTSAKAITNDLTLADLSTSAETFDIALDGNDSVTVTLSQIDYTANGKTFDDFASDLETQINAALSASGQSSTVSVTANSPLTFESGTAGSGSSLSFSNISSALQSALGVSDANGTGMSFVPGVDADDFSYYDTVNKTFTTTVPNAFLSAGGAAVVGDEGAPSSGSGGGIGGSGSTGEFVVAGTISGIDLLTAEGASEAISVIDTALEQVSQLRANLGVVINRLAHAIDNMSNQSMSTQISLGQIIDADMAVEVSKLVKTQILSKSAQQIMSQSWRNQNVVLGLIG